MPFIKESHTKYLSPPYYQYSGKDHSLVSKYVLQPFWRALVPFIPEHMAPNAITLIGLCLNLTCYFLLSYYSPNCHEVVPRWALLFAGFGLFVYQTLDALDGKQARRTGSSSALGELFDHGCDAVSTHLISINVLVAMGETRPLQLAFYVWVSQAGFWLAQYENAVTGTLVLGYINGPSEGLVLLYSTMIVSGIFTPSIFSRALPAPLNAFLPDVRSAMYAFTLISAICTTVANINNSIRAVKDAQAAQRAEGTRKAGRAASKPRGDKDGGASAAAETAAVRLESPLPLMIITAAYAMLWLGNFEGAAANLRWTLCAMGMSLATATTLLCLARVSRDRQPLLPITTLVFVLGCGYCAIAQPKGHHFGWVMVRWGHQLGIPFVKAVGLVVVLSFLCLPSSQWRICVL